VKKQLPSRNDPCSCGSGNKYKKCCLPKPAPEAGMIDSAPYLRRAHYFMKQGELSSAEEVFEQALKIDKKSIEGLVGLGQCLCQQYRKDEAGRVLLQAGRILVKQARKMRDVRSLLDLAYLMINLQISNKALELTNEALKIAPDFPRGHHTKALALQKTSIENALVCSKRAVKLAPDEANAILLLATLEAKQGDALLAKQRLLQLNGNGLGVDRARVKHELAAIYDKLGEYEQAFKYFVEAGELSLQTQEVKAIDKEVVFLDVERSKQSFDKEYLQNCGSKIDDNLPAPVFLIGFYRSGTTLMEQILGAHPQVITSDEAPIIPSVIVEIARISELEGTIQEKVKALTAEQIAVLREFYWRIAEKMMGLKLSGKVFVDKTAMNTLNLGLMNTLFPESTVLFALREPKDVRLSCFMQSFGLSPLTVHFLDWKSGARLYASIMEYWFYVRDHLTMSWVEIHYEDVLKDIEGQFSDVFNLLGLEWSSECEKFYQHAKNKELSTPSFDQVTKPIYHSSVGRWQYYEKYFEGM